MSNPAPAATAALQAAVREAEIVLRKGAPSLAIADDRHYAVALLDRDGLVAALSRPSQLGVIASAGKAILETIPDLADGEVALSNDPAYGGSHIHDFTLVTPLGEAGFGLARLHTVDVAGDVLGGFNPGAVTPWEEGALFPPMRVGTLEEIEDEIGVVLEFNTRLPDLLRGDLAAARAALAGLRERFAADAGLAGDLAAAIEFGERTAAELIGGLDGGGSASASVDHCCTGVGATEIQVALSLAGETLNLDFSGSGPVVPAPINSPIGSTRFAALLPLVLAIDPAAANEGLLRRVAIEVPEGGLLAAPADAASGFAPYRTAAAVAGAAAELLVAAGLEVAPFDGEVAEPRMRFSVPACTAEGCRFDNRREATPPVTNRQNAE